MAFPNALTAASAAAFDPAFTGAADFDRAFTGSPNFDPAFTQRRNLYPAFTERGHRLGLPTDTKASIIRSLMQLAVASRAGRP
jgi:hypothetical protein